MKFESAFAVQAPAQQVWEALMDVERVTPCMPGAEVLERIGEDAYRVGIKVKVGPISMLYRGQVEIIERDEIARQATMRASAKEARGQGTADAHIHMSLVEQPDGTHATIQTELQVSGRAAAMGQGVITDVAQKLVEAFAANLARMLVAEPALETTPEPAPTATEQPPSGAIASSEASPPPHIAATQTTLPVGKITASVIAGRLSNPRTLLIAGVTFAAIFAAIRYAIRKHS